PTLDESLLSTGYPYDIRRTCDNNLAEHAAFMVRCRSVREMGSAAINLALVAAGRLDGFWELVLGPWDVAAGCLMVEDAGGPPPARGRLGAPAPPRRGRFQRQDPRRDAGHPPRGARSGPQRVASTAHRD